MRGQCMLVNLRMESAETKALGVNHHICEVQLILRSQEVLIDQVFPDYTICSFVYISPEALSLYVRVA